MNEKFSVLMSVYYKENPIYLKEAMESIYDKQILKPTEIVLVEDGKLTEELYQEINRQKEKLKNILKIVKLEKNSGLGKALNVGVLNCTNELIARMDSDDISCSERFLKQIECFKNNENIDIVGSNISEFINDVNNIVGIRNVYENDIDIKKDMKKRCSLNHVTVIFKKSKILEVGNYLEWFCNEDYYLWLRLLKNNAIFKNISESLVFVRVGMEMYGRRGGMKYFKSEADIQKYMLENKMITQTEYFRNIFVRFVVQILLPNWLRKVIYLKILRKNIKDKKCQN